MIQKRNDMPPMLANWLIKKLSRYEKHFSLEGDLLEAWEYSSKKEGKRKANLWYWSQTIKTVLSYLQFIIRGDLTMLKSYFMFTIRNILKHKVYSFINISGLAVGVACCILIFLYLQNELTYDKYHENSERIYRISSTYITSGEPIRFAVASPALGPLLKEEFPEIEDYVRIVPASQILVTYDEKNKSFNENNIVLADPSIFEVFTYEFIHGNPATCLADPKSIILTEKLAAKYFGNESPIGKILNLDDEDNLTVTGVIKTPPQNSHLKIEGIAPFTLLPENLRQNPSMFEVIGYTYILLQENYDFNRFDEKWPAFYEKYCSEDAKLYGQVFEPNFIKLADIRYNTMHFRFDVEVGSKLYLFAFIFIGIFILVLACINYINMTTAINSIAV